MGERETERSGMKRGGREQGEKEKEKSRRIGMRERRE